MGGGVETEAPSADFQKEYGGRRKRKMGSKVGTTKQKIIFS